MNPLPTLAEAFDQRARECEQSAARWRGDDTFISTRRHYEGKAAAYREAAEMARRADTPTKESP